jgi:hypothetical protein
MPPSIEYDTRAMNTHELILLLEQTLGDMDLGYLEDLKRIREDGVESLEVKVAGQKYRIHIEEID